MMRQILSQGQVYDVVLYNPEKDMKDGRTDLTAQECTLQVCLFKVKEDKVVKAHRHNPIERLTHGTQESLIVIKGSVTVHLYGVDNEDLGEYELEAGDAVVFLKGAHAVTLAAGALVYEVKNGPYENVEKDKVYIE